MTEVYYKFEGVTVKIIDKSSHEERKKRLEQPLNDFFRKVQEYGNYSRKTD
mgnify:CR=1 FL=1|jgi:hypothetical protein